MWAWIWAIGCTGDATTKPGTTTPTDSGTTPVTHTTPTPTDGTPTPTGTTGDTGGTTTTPTYAQPSSVTATCDPTANPLRFLCHVTVDPPQPVQIAFSKADGTGAERIHQGPLVEGTQDVGLYFMAPGIEYAYTASAVAWPAGPVATGSITTGTVPSDLAASLTLTGTSSTPYVGADLPCGAGAKAAVFDSATGEMLWYQVADSGGNFGGFEMVTFTEDHTILGQSGTQVMEIALTGQELLRKYEGIDYAEDLHHDLYKHDGLIYLLYHQGSPTLDGFLIWDSTGTELGRWFSGDYLTIPGSASGDWMHTNTIYERDGYVYLSSYAQDTVFKVDGDLASATFGEAQWFLAGTSGSGLGDDFTIDWSNVSGTDGFQHQHDVHLTADGRLLMLDNQHGRALVMDLDEAALTGTVETAYPASKSSCGPQGTAMETASGDFLVDCSGSTVQEYAPAGTSPVWTATLVCKSGGGGPFSLGSSRWYPLDGW